MSRDGARTTSDATAPGRPLRVGLVSLGCAKNLVDAELMIGALLQDGFQVLNETAEADVVIVNTCSFIDAAKEESVDTILESAALRDARRRGQGLVVAGCLPQRFTDELPKLMPEVDAFLGIDQVTEVARIVRAAHARRQHQTHRTGVGRRQSEAVPAPGPITTSASVVPATPARPATPAEAPVLEVNRRPRYIPDYTTPRFRLTPPHFAYVKIAEGCNHPCSFCTIPQMRGSHRSRQPADVVEEVRRLVGEGVREINLISQDSTYYGRDLHARRGGTGVSPVGAAAVTRAGPADAPTLAKLLRGLQAVPGDFWVRLLYTHPAHWTDDLIRTLADCPAVARYVDMPLQHIHDNLLERMRRETSRAAIEDLIDRIRSRIPGIALRTTFIVGFPGETEACFRTLLDFIRSTRFERLGVFAYSREEGTRAARMHGQVPDRVKRERRDRAMAEQRRVSRELAAAQVGRVLRVLVEGRATARDLEQMGRSSDGWMVARGEADAPDIDGRVYLRGRRPAGKFTRVLITGHTDYDLLAEPEASLR